MDEIICYKFTSHLKKKRNAGGDGSIFDGEEGEPSSKTSGQAIKEKKKGEFSKLSKKS